VDYFVGDLAKRALELRVGFEGAEDAGEL